MPSKSSEHVLRVFRLQKGLCFHCERPMDRHAYSVIKPKGWSREHLIPKAGGGSNRRYNIVLAHWPCNARRGDAMPTQEMLGKRDGLYADERRMISEGDMRQRKHPIERNDDGRDAA